MATFTQQISDTNNDVFVSLDGSAIDFNGDSELIIGEHPSSALNLRYEAGLRFTNVTIPKGDTISSATITFTAAGAESGTPSFTIKCEAADDAAAFSTYADFVARSKTTASASWSPSGLVNNVTVDTTNFASALQEVVNRASWASGNDLVVFVTPPASYNDSWILVYERTQSSTKCAQLNVTYAPPSGPTNLKTWNGIAKASVKTRNGVAIASIKTANGIT